MSLITRILGATPRLLPLSWQNKHVQTVRLSTESGEKREVTESEAKLIGLLRARFPKARHIDVVDISGGCGAMYTVYVETSEFRNMRTVRQHQMVNDVLLAEIKNNMHGLRIQTAVPPPSPEDASI